jgi:hypothetical protein
MEDDIPEFFCPPMTSTPLCRRSCIQHPLARFFFITREESLKRVSQEGERRKKEGEGGEKKEGEERQMKDNIRSENYHKPGRPFPRETRKGEKKERTC